MNPGFGDSVYQIIGTKHDRVNHKSKNTFKTKTKTSNSQQQGTKMQTDTVQSAVCISVTPVVVWRHLKYMKLHSDKMNSKLRWMQNYLRSLKENPKYIDGWTLRDQEQQNELHRTKQRSKCPGEAGASITSQKKEMGVWSLHAAHQMWCVWSAAQLSFSEDCTERLWPLTAVRERDHLFQWCHFMPPQG